VHSSAHTGFVDVQHLQVARGGRFEGDGEVKSLDVAGTVIAGNLEVASLLSVFRTGLVRGQLRYGSLELAEGGVVDDSSVAQLSPTPQQQALRDQQPAARVFSPPRTAAADSAETDLMSSQGSSRDAALLYDEVSDAQVVAQQQQLWQQAQAQTAAERGAPRNRADVLLALLTAEDLGPALSSPTVNSAVAAAKSSSDAPVNLLSSLRVAEADMSCSSPERSSRDSSNSSSSSESPTSSSSSSSGDESSDCVSVSRRVHELSSIAEEPELLSPGWQVQLQLTVNLSIIVML
jgi:Polymer-forming cytoskeletal